MRRTACLALAVTLSLSTLTACGGEDSSGKKVTLRVFAAASLTESFTALGKKFHEEHPGTKVVFEFGPSSGLAEQIGQGAPADVFASASPTNMDTVVQKGNASDPQDFVTNSAEIAVPPSNPASITQLSDLARPGVKVVVCQPQVPCGKVAAQVFAKAGVTVKPVSEEVDVKSTLAKVTLGEADAGMVYVTDVLAGGLAGSVWLAVVLLVLLRARTGEASSRQKERPPPISRPFRCPNLREETGAAQRPMR